MRAGLMGRRYSATRAGVVALILIFCGTAKPEELFASDTQADALTKACEAWAKTIHLGTRYGPGLGENTTITRNSVVPGVYIYGRRTLLLEDDGRIASASCG